MKVPEGILIPENLQRPCVKVLKSLYGLKQSGRQWFTKYAETLKSAQYKNCIECPSVFLKNTKEGPVITSIYVDDTNVMGPPKAVSLTKQFLKSHFEMKDFGDVSSCIGIQFVHFEAGTFIYQGKLIERILQTMNLNNSKRTFGMSQMTCYMSI
ncbi:DNA-directed DNA polymerase [Synchytrium endobioticum]|uniref:DNA-directed DNA polymerase n=1 Tax=Synchytrium endobioticum TaxID=286115 RepID=A0A507BG09_9FUNG|nr:DNA-directed DNA polymerase [Synchytrium endobioticum]